MITKLIINIIDFFENWRYRDQDWRTVHVRQFWHRCCVCHKFNNRIDTGFNLGWPSDHDGEFVCGKCISRLVDEELEWQNRESGL